MFLLPEIVVLTGMAPIQTRGPTERSQLLYCKLKLRGTI